MKGILKKDFVYKGLAVLLAILLWLYVINMKDPTVERPLTVPVSYENLQEGLVVRNKPENVEIRIKGPHSLVNPLSAKEIKATLNLAKAQLGEEDFFVEIALPPGVELVFMKPSSIKVAIDALEMKQLPIQVILKGAVAQGYSSFEPVLQPSAVVVRGSRQMLEKLETALVTVNLNQAKENLSLNCPVALLTKEGNTVTAEYDISPREVQVFVPVTKPNNTLTVSIKPQIKGVPKEGLQVAGVVLDPETVKISGPYEILSRINHVSTAPLDITGIAENYATQVALVPPDGASLVYQPVVKILVQVEAVAVTKNLTDIPVTVTNSVPGYRYMIAPENISLTIKGSKKVMETLDKSIAIKAFIDVEGLKPGTHNLAIKTEIPAELQVVKVEPSTVEVKTTEGNE